MTSSRAITTALIVLLVVAHLIISSAHASQTIYEMHAPETVEPGIPFTVKLGVQYSFVGEGDVRVWAKIFSPSIRESVAAPREPARLVNGKGTLEWHLELTSSSQERVVLTLEAHAFHWDKNEREILDDTRSFTVTVVPPLPFVEIMEIEAVEPPETVSLGEITPVVVSIRYYNLVSGTRLEARIRDIDAGKVLSHVISGVLSKNGNYTFEPINVRPRNAGEWHLRAEVRPCTTGLCVVENLAEERFNILVSGVLTPSFDFLISATPISQSTVPSGYLTYDVHVALDGEESATVNLSLSDLPEGAAYTFDPPAGNPDFDSKLTVHIPGTVAPGSFILTITGEGGGLAQTATVELVVESAQGNRTYEPPTEPPKTTPPPTAKTTGSILPLEALVGLTAAILLIIASIPYYVRRTVKKNT